MLREVGESAVEGTGHRRVRDQPGDRPAGPRLGGHREHRRLGGAGYGTFNADPDGSIPGDAIRACDTKADGWGVEAALDYPPFDLKMDRIVDTRGHAAGYCTPWKDGDLREGITYRLYVTPVSDDQYGPSRCINVVP